MLDWLTFGISKDTSLIYNKERIASSSIEEPISISRNNTNCTCSFQGNKLIIKVNPAKWLTGSNITGTNNLYKSCSRIVSLLGILNLDGSFLSISQVDIHQMTWGCYIRMPKQEAVMGRIKTLLGAYSLFAPANHHQLLFSGTGLTVRSPTKSLTLYNKGTESGCSGHESLMRIECLFRYNSFTSLTRKLSYWKNIPPSFCLDTIQEQIAFFGLDWIQTVPNIDKPKGIPTRLLPLLAAWKQGKASSRSLGKLAAYGIKPNLNPLFYAAVQPLLPKKPYSLTANLISLDPDL